MGLRPATIDDLSAIRALLAGAELPVAGIEAIVDDFVVATDSVAIIGAGAIEMHGGYGLLRSVVVAPASRGKGVGKTIVQALIDGRDGDLYVLTETAGRFFVRFGFSYLSREEAPPALRASEEFRCLCPESASFMRRSVSKSF